ncbi:MAG: hypothetical protein ACXABX_09655, partial [Candidatus Thorarchaeota archaeon]
MLAHRNLRHVAVAFLIISFFILPIAAFDRGIPTATYEILYGGEIDENESINTSSTPFSPVSSVLLLNDSVMGSDTWLKQKQLSSNRSWFSKQITIPYLNVNETTFKLSAFVVSGPLEIRMSIYPFPYENRSETVIGQTGEYSEIVRQASPDEYDDYQSEGLSWVHIYIPGYNWSVIDELYFSIEVLFNIPHCPVMIDLQRTNGESIYESQELRTIYDEENFPKFFINDSVFHLSKPNDTIFLHCGNHSLSFRWFGYSHSFRDVSVHNESLYLEVRIKSVRLDVESVQRVPGVVITIGEYFGHDELYGEQIMIKDSPSFYLPSGRHETVRVEGNPLSSSYPTHFLFDLDFGNNRNVTLLINENWILIGNIAFTPGKLVVLILSLLILTLTLILSRRKMANSSVVGPFILLFLGSIFPTLSTVVQLWHSPLTLPLYSYYTKSISWSPVIATTTASYADTAI